jgi:maltose alpha-D-glucosyltransferase / alpha-amylase
VPMDWSAVDAQRRDPDSLVNWMGRLIRCRRDNPEFGWGTSTLLETTAPALFAHKCDWEGSTVVAVHNLGEGEMQATLDLGEEVKGVRDLLVDREHTVTKEGKLDVKLGRYGYLWLKVEPAG